MTDWAKIGREFSCMDLINVSQCFKLSKYRQRWLMRKYNEKQDNIIEEINHVCKRSELWSFPTHQYR